jgi:formamidopyrimidine-DNA glycosylase
VQAELVGATVSGLDRRGKLLLLELDTNMLLAVHLRMTGQLVFRASRPADVPELANAPEPANAARSAPSSELAPFAPDFGGGAPSDSLVAALPDKSTRVIISFNDGSRLYFNDQRKFGYMQLLPAAELEHNRFVASLGPDPTASGFTWQDLRASLPAGSKRPIKAALLDQSVLAGIGNIYADESLHRAHIDPATPVFALSVAQLKRLHQAIRACLSLAIESGGSTSRNYVNAQGLRGEFLDLHAQVYNRSGQPCVYCGTPIVKRKLAGRGTHVCPKCQK